MPAAGPPPTRSRVVLGAGIRLRVTEHGPAGAPTVVLVHGYPDTSALWDRVVGRLAADAVGPALHVVTYDVRGAGGSERPARTSGYALDRLLDDLAAVLDATADGPVHLVGHDWGAIQALAAAAAGSPVAGRLASVTAVSAPGLDLVGWWVRAAWASRSPRRLLAVAGQLVRSWYVAAFQVPLLARLVWRGGLARRWRAVAGPDGAAPTLADDAVAGVGLYRANRGRVARPSPLRYDLPVRVVTASGDPFVSPRVFDRLPEHGDDTAVEVVRTRSHWLPRTHPEVVARTVREQVARADRTR